MISFWYKGIHDQFLIEGIDDQFYILNVNHLHICLYFSKFILK